MAIQKFIGAAILMTATIGWSQTSPEEHAAHHPSDTRAANTPGPQSGMAQVRALIEKAEHARTGAERERLLAEHLAAMRKQLEGLESRQCSMDEPMSKGQGAQPGDGAKPGMMQGGMKEGGMMGDHMKMCHAMMKARMETMAELLAQTWRREELRRK